MLKVHKDVGLRYRNIIRDCDQLTKRVDEGEQKVQQELNAVKSKVDCLEEEVDVKLTENVNQLKKKVDCLEDGKERILKEHEILRTDVDRVSDKLNLLDKKDKAEAEEESDFSKNVSRKNTLLVDGLFVNRRNKKKNQKIAVDFLQSNFPTVDITGLSKVSFLSKNENNNTLKVDFDIGSKTVREILAEADRKKIQNVREFVTVETIVRRMLLDVVAKQINSKSIIAEVPQRGTRPWLLVENKEEHYTEKLNFVNAICKFYIKKENEADEEERLKHVYDFANIHVSKKNFPHFIILN
jgi:hypothetical protein